MGNLLLVAHWRPQISHISIITGNVRENSSFEKIRTILINLIELHYFDDEFNLIDLKVSQTVILVSRKEATKVSLVFLFWENQEQIT